MVRGVLFDLDGTLLDTAKDMLFALDLLAKENGIKEIPNYKDGKELITHGSRAIVNSIFPSIDKSQFLALQKRYLEIYEANLNRQTCFFSGVEHTLKELNLNNIPWGVVTNKPDYLARPLIQQIPLFRTSKILISGDTTPYSKPHPLPLLEAAKHLGLTATDILYVGDAKSDIDAAKAAKMHNAVASWGYISANENLEQWNSDKVFRYPSEILEFN